MMSLKVVLVSTRLGRLPPIHPTAALMFGSRSSSPMGLRAEGSECPPVSIMAASRLTGWTPASIHLSPSVVLDFECRLRLLLPCRVSFCIDPPKPPLCRKCPSDPDIFSYSPPALSAYSAASPGAKTPPPRPEPMLRIFNAFGIGIHFFLCLCSIKFRAAALGRGQPSPDHRLYTFQGLNWRRGRDPRCGEGR